jgi:ribosome maturation factor RimP
VSIAERVREIVEPLLAGHSLELVDVEHAGSALRITVDGAEPVDLETIARVTRIVSLALDEHDPIPSRYTLEVSSPGLERPLRTPAHFAKAVGSTITVKTVPGADSDRRIKGRLEAAGDDGITIDGRTLRYQDIEKARTVFEWGPAPKPRAAKKKATAR